MASDFRLATRNFLAHFLCLWASPLLLLPPLWFCSQGCISPLGWACFHPPLEVWLPSPRSARPFLQLHAGQEMRPSCPIPVSKQFSKALGLSSESHPKPKRGRALSLFSWLPEPFEIRVSLPPRPQLQGLCPFPIPFPIFCSQPCTSSAPLSTWAAVVHRASAPLRILRSPPAGELFL